MQNTTESIQAGAIVRYSNPQNGEGIFRFLVREIHLDASPARVYVESLNCSEDVIKPVEVLAPDEIRLETREETISDMASEFVGLLQCSLHREEFVQVIVRNRFEKNPRVCHSHDFIDANEIAAEAFEATMGRPMALLCDHEPDADGKLPEAVQTAVDADLDLLNEVWSKFKELLDTRPAFEATRFCLMNAENKSEFAAMMHAPVLVLGVEQAQTWGFSAGLEKMAQGMRNVWQNELSRIAGKRVCLEVHYLA